MSEPFAALVQVTIDRAALIAYLAAPPRPASQWHDWSRIGGTWHGFSWERDEPAMLARVDGWLKGPYRAEVRGILKSAEAPALGRCSYDERTGSFTVATLTLSVNLNDIVLFFTVVRALAHHMQGSDSGFAVVHNYLWPRHPSTVAVMGLGADGYSYFLDAQDDAPAYDQHVRDAKAVFDDMRAPPVIDELDRLR